MLTKVEVDDLQGHTLSLPLFDAPPGFLITNIDGLDPVKSTIVSSSFGQLDGSQFQSARRENRNLVLSVKLEPYSGEQTVQQLRAKLYQFFMPKTNVTIRFFNDGVLTYLIDGMVESCESAMFAKDPEMAISIMCFEPNFRAPMANTFGGGTVSGNAESTIVNTGNVETGYVFKLNVNRDISGFSILNRRPNGSMAQLDFSGSLVNGDVVEISTEFMDKHATLTHGGAASSVLYGVSPASKWGPLWPGANLFRVLVPGTTMGYTVAYTPKYGGL